MILRSLRRLVGSVRVRVAVVAGLAFALVMVVASLLLLHMLESRLIKDIRAANERALQTQATNLMINGLPPIAEAPTLVDVGNGVVAFTVGAGTGQVVVAAADGESQPIVPDQVFEASAIPVSAVFVESLNGAPMTQYSVAVPLDPASARLLGVAGQEGPFLTSSVQVSPGLSLITAASLAEVDSTLSTTRTLLWYVVPVLVLLVSGLAWMLVGRALRPVHALTARAATISARSLHERVPVPSADDEVAELATTINSMLDRIETSDRASRRLVSDASHELRTPITVMRTELEVARRDPHTTWDVVSENVLTEVDRLQTLVDDLLLLARMSEQGTTSAQFSLLDIVRDVTSRRRRVGVRLANADIADVLVVGDSSAVQRAIDHVVANAARHADTRVDIHIAADPDAGKAGSAVVHVDDDGPGIDPADREGVLQRFVRLDEARSRDGGGSGLGLAVARDVMVAHHGSVTISESPLGGARVSLRFNA
ncbi:MAG: HAMP domain-containing protein [Actinomycetia bacterium]|nr:HAMP domain-containing protein [Actinomycetes bacterium]